MALPEGYKLFREYMEELKTTNRFFPDEKYLRLFDRIINNKTNIETVPSDTKLYRARRNKLKQEFTLKSELGINKKSTSHNRASPIGISYMYLADEPETAIAEIRANVLEHTTVATYLTKRNLKMLCLDSSGSYGGSSSDEFSSKCVVGFIFALSLSFSRPIQGISELEYLPCQYFAEYCKKNGFDGIKYISSARGFHGDVERKHFNYVLFNANDVIQKAAYKYLINNISYTITQAAAARSAAFLALAADNPFGTSQVVYFRSCFPSLFFPK